MKIKFISNIMKITSSLKNSEVASAKVYCPGNLSVKDDEGHPFFKVDTGLGDSGSITSNGMIFNTTDPDGNLVATIPIPADLVTESAKLNYAKNTYGVALTKLTQAEQEIVAAINATTSNIDKVFEDAEVE